MTIETFTSVSMVLYAAAAVVYALMWLKSARLLRVVAPVVLGAGLVVNLLQLVSRWVDTSQPPFKTLFESLVLLAACIALVYLVIELIYRARILGLPSALGCALPPRDGFG